jgi:hypothetical protein
MAVALAWMAIGMRVIVVVAGISGALLLCAVSGQTNAQTETPEIPPGLLMALQSDTSTAVKKCVEQEGVPLRKMLRARWLDLGGTGKRSIVLEGLPPCLWGNSNGTILVYVRRGDGWHKVLDGIGSTLRRRSTTTQGWPDLVLWQHDTAFDGIELAYRFNGEEYRAVSCTVVESANPLNGKRYSSPKKSFCNWDWKASKQ